MNSLLCGKRSTIFCAMIDAHVHVTGELLPYLQNVQCIANADSPEEYRFLKSSGLPVISAGIHPWKADVTDWSAMEPILRTVPVIGEIGLDCVWCDVDMDVQRKVFCRQLKLASELGKPVILHTKGMEREILDTIRQYPNRYLVHWYSCEEYLQEYIELGCRFTVGPDVRADVAMAVPLDRLLIESDGLEAIAWAKERDVSAQEYPRIMSGILHETAALRRMNAEALLGQMEENLKSFLK